MRQAMWGRVTVGLAVIAAGYLLLTRGDIPFRVVAVVAFGIYALFDFWRFMAQGFVSRRTRFIDVDDAPAPRRATAHAHKLLKEDGFTFTGIKARRRLLSQIVTHHFTAERGLIHAVVTPYEADPPTVQLFSACGEAGFIESVVPGPEVRLMDVDEGDYQVRIVPSGLPRALSEHRAALNLFPVRAVTFEALYPRLAQAPLTKYRPLLVQRLMRYMVIAILMLIMWVAG